MRHTRTRYYNRDAKDITSEGPKVLIPYLHGDCFQERSHVFRFSLVLISVIVVVVLVLLLLIIRLLGIILLFLLALLHLAHLLPFLREAICFGSVICDDDVVENRPALHLPQIEADEAEVAILVNAIVIFVLWICNFLCFPKA